MLWHSAGLNQSFGAETRLATGRSSTATISIDDGLELVLDPDSLIVLTKAKPQQLGEDSTFLVTLAKGRVVVQDDRELTKSVPGKNTPKNKSRSEVPKLIVKTSDQILTLRKTEIPVVVEKPQLDSHTEVVAPVGAVETRPTPPPAAPSKLPPPSELGKIVLALLDQSDEPEPPTSPDELRGTAEPSNSASAAAEPIAEAKNPLPQLNIPPQPASELLQLPTIAEHERSPPEKGPDLLGGQPLQLAALATKSSDVDEPGAVEPKSPSVIERPMIVAGYEPTLMITGINAPDQLVLWTYAKPSEKLPPLRVTVVPPENRHRPEWQWTPLIHVEGLDSGEHLERGVGDFQSQKLNIPLAAAGDKQALALGWTLRLTAGVEIGRPEDAENKTFAQHASRVSLRSFAALDDRPLTLTLDCGEDGEYHRSGWLRETRSLSNSERPGLWRIELVHGSDLLKLRRLIATSKAFNVQAGPIREIAEQQIRLTLMADGHIQAVMVVKHLRDLNNFRRVATLLGSDLAYLGPPEALIPRTIDRAALHTQSGLIYAFNLFYGEKLFGVSQTFVSGHRNLQSFLETIAGAFFNRPVEIIFNGFDEKLSSKF